LKEGVELLICLNPLVPYDDRLNPKNHRRRAKGKAFQPGSRLYEGGLPLVLSQTFRSIIHSRMDIGMERYGHLYPNADIVLFEPQHGDGEFFSPTRSVTPADAVCASMLTNAPVRNCGHVGTIWPSGFQGTDWN